jgi:LacI family transcriptional regulator
MAPIRYIIETSSADGVIISRTQADDPRVRYLIENNMPFATHGRTEMNVIHPYHDFDNHAFAYEAVSILAGKGRKNIALLGPPPGLLFQKHTRSGFDQGLKDFGLSEFSLGDLNLDSDTSAILAAGRALARAPYRPDGVVCCTTSLAVNFSSGLIQGGSVIGDDIDIVSKETYHLFDQLHPGIIFFQENLRAAGRGLAMSVVAWIAGADPSTLQFLIKPSRRSS